MSPIQESYNEQVTTMRALGTALIPAVAARYDAPPTGRSSPTDSRGIRNPTLDIVTDPRRMAVSDAISAAETALRLATATLRPHIDTLRQAVARWEGQEGPE